MHIPYLNNMWYMVKYNKINLREKLKINKIKEKKTVLYSVYQGRGSRSYAKHGTYRTPKLTILSIVVVNY